MRCISALMIFVGITIVAATGQESIRYDFNAFDDGPIDGQMEWNVYEKVVDSSALSIKDVLGTSEKKGDKALVIKSSMDGIRCVTGQPVRWLPGRTLSMVFDFKVAVAPDDSTIEKPVLTVMIGDALLSEKARWSIQLLATPKGDWRLIGHMPDEAQKTIYGENFFVRMNNEVTISRWYTFTLIAEKKSEPDAFSVQATIKNAVSGEQLVELDFTDEEKNKVAAAMWNTSRAHAGFQAAPGQLGMVCIDNLVISSSK